MKIKKSKLKSGIIHLFEHFRKVKCGDCPLGELVGYYKRWSCSKGWGDNGHPLQESFDKCIMIDKLFDEFMENSDE